MNAKSYLILYYSIAGVIISFFTAVMTYIIIDVPIGPTMTFKIFLTILVTLPIIGILSYMIGTGLSKKLAAISTCLNNISENKFLDDKHDECIVDINQIHESIHQLSHRLEDSISKLKNSNRQLNTMIFALSHDIKTPLTIIEGYLEELEDDIVSIENRPKIFATIRRETSYINDLSSEVILYLQTLDGMPNQVNIHLEDFVYEEVSPLLAVKKTVELKVEIEDDFSLEFCYLGLKNILLNLLHNASKHTDQGTITIKTFEESIIVEDTGVGIDSIHVKNIFEPFYCVDESKNREKNGFGLGLSIASNLAQSNGYKLYLDKTYTNGSRFVLEKLTDK